MYVSVANSKLWTLLKNNEKKIGPWGPELIWQLATKYKMSRHQRHLQDVIIYRMTNEGGVSIFGMYVSQKGQNVNFLKIHNFKNIICRCIIYAL